MKNEIKQNDYKIYFYNGKKNIYSEYIDLLKKHHAFFSITDVVDIKKILTNTSKGFLLLIYKSEKKIKIFSSSLIINKKLKSLDDTTKMIELEPNFYQVLNIDNLKDNHKYVSSNFFVLRNNKNTKKMKFICTSVLFFLSGLIFSTFYISSANNTIQNIKNTNTVILTKENFEEERLIIEEEDLKFQEIASTVFKTIYLLQGTITNFSFSRDKDESIYTISLKNCSPEKLKQTLLANTQNINVSILKIFYKDNSPFYDCIIKHKNNHKISSVKILESEILNFSKISGIIIKEIEFSDKTIINGHVPSYNIPLVLNNLNSFCFTKKVGISRLFINPETEKITIAFYEDISNEQTITFNNEHLKSIFVSSTIKKENQTALISSVKDTNKIVGKIRVNNINNIFSKSNEGKFICN